MSDVITIITRRLRSFISPPHRDWNFRYLVHLEVDWTRGSAYAAPMYIAAATTTKEAAEAALRLLMVGEPDHGPDR